MLLRKVKNHFGGIIYGSLTLSYFFMILENAERFIKLVHSFANNKHTIIDNSNEKKMSR